MSGNVFANPDASSSAPYPQELNPWSSSTEEPIHSSTVEKSERRTQDQDQRCQSGQSAKNSVIFSGGDISKNSMDLAYMCVKHQMRSNVCHQMRLYVCHQMRLLNPQNGAQIARLPMLASLARFLTV